MIVTLTFNLPEEKDEHTLAIKGSDYWSALWDLDQWLRDIIKYHSDDKDLNIDTLEVCRNQLREIMSEHGVSLDDAS